MKPRKPIRKLKAYVPGVLKKGAVKLASNENPLGPSPKAIKALAKNIDKINLYPDISCLALKQKLSEKFNISPSQFVVGNGSDEVMMLIAGAYIEESDIVLAYKPSFSVYTFASKLFGGKMRYFRLKDGKADLSKMAKLVDKKTKVVFLCNPNNPTGTYFSGEELETFLEFIPKNVLVVIDEAYAEYAQAKDFPNSVKLLSSHKNIVILRTFSKIYGLAGLRIGYGIGSEEIIVNLEKARAPFSVSLPAQYAAQAALADAAFIRKSITNNNLGKEYLYRELDKLGFKYYPTQANFIFIFVNQDGKKAFEQLMELGVTVRPLNSFGCKNAIRVTVGTPEQNRKFINCLKKII